jgi:hypothetical protein
MISRCSFPTLTFLYVARSHVYIPTAGHVSSASLCEKFVRFGKFLSFICWLLLCGIMLSTLLHLESSACPFPPISLRITFYQFFECYVSYLFSICLVPTFEPMIPVSQPKSSLSYPSRRLLSFLCILSRCFLLRVFAAAAVCVVLHLLWPD